MIELTLGNGEVVPLTDRMRIVVESSDAAAASPATLSRCAVVAFHDVQRVTRAFFRLPLTIHPFPQAVDKKAEREFARTLKALPASDQGWALTLANL